MKNLQGSRHFAQMYVLSFSSLENTSFYHVGVLDMIWENLV